MASLPEIDKIKLEDIDKVIYARTDTDFEDLNIFEVSECCTWAKKFNLTIETMPQGTAKMSIKRSSARATLSTIGTIATNTFDNQAAVSVPIYYGDRLELGELTNPENYTSPSYSPALPIMVTDNIKIKVMAGDRLYAITYPAFSNIPGLDDYIVYDYQSSLITYITPDQAEIGGKVYVREGTKIAVSYNKSVGYNIVIKYDGVAYEPYAPITITKDGTLELVALPIGYKLTVEALPQNGVNSYIVKRIKSPIGLQKENETIVTASKGGTTQATIYHLDELVFTAEEEPGYYEPEAYPSGIIIFDAIESPGGITARVQAGAREKYTLTASKSNARLSIKKQDGTTIENGYSELVYGDILTISANCDWTMYENLSLMINGVKQDIVTNVRVTVTGPIEIVASAQAKKYQLTYPAAPSGISYRILKSVDQYSQTELVSYEEARIGGTKEVTSEEYIIFINELVDSTHWNIPLLHLNGQDQEWENPIRLTDNTEMNIIPEPKEYTFELSTVLGAKNVKVTRTSTQKYGAQINQTITTSTPIYYNDTLTATADLESNYKDLTFSWRMDNKTTIGANITVTGNVTLSVDAIPIPYKVYYNARPTGVSSDYYIRYIPNAGSQTQEINPTSDGYFEAAVGDAFVIVGLSAAAGYNTPNVYVNGVQNNNWSSDDGIPVTGEMTIRVEAGSMIPYTLTISKGDNVSTHTVNRIKTQNPNATTGELSNGSIIYYGDKLEAVATAADGFYTPTTNWTNNITTVTGHTTSKSTHGGPIEYTLTCPALPANLNKYTVYRVADYQNTYMQREELCSISTDYPNRQQISVYHGDILTLEINSYKPGYKNATASFNGVEYDDSFTVNASNVELTFSEPEVISYILTIPALYTGVSSLKVNRQKSSLVNTPNPWETKDATTTEQKVTVYYGDIITATATASEGYYNPKVTYPSGIIKGDSSITLTAGAKKCIITYPATTTPGLYKYQIMDVTNGEANAPILKSYNVMTDGTLEVPSGTNILIYMEYDNTNYNEPYLTANGNEWKGGSLSIGGDTEIGIYSQPKQFAFSISSMLGVDSVEVTRRSTNKYGASTGIINSSTPIYYGDVLELTKVNLKDNYHNPEPSWNNNGTYSSGNSITVRGNVTLSVNAELKQAQVTCNAIPKGVNDNYYFTAISSAAIGSANYYPTSSSIIFTVNIGDSIIIHDLSQSVGYNKPSVKVNGTIISESVYKEDGITINNNTTIEIVAGSMIAYKLTKTTGSGIASHTVTRISTDHPTAGTGTLNNNDNIYYGDVLSVNTQPEAWYSQARTNWTNNRTTVTGATTSETYVMESDFRTFDLTYYVLPDHVSSYYVKRTSSPIKGDTSNWQVYVNRSANYSGTKSFYYGDVLELTVVYDDGFNGTAKLTGSPTSNREVSITNIDILTAIIVLPALKTGVSSITLTKRTSPIAQKDEGKTWSATTSEQRITAYYGDGFDISGTGTSPAYNPPSIVPSSFGIDNTNTVTFTVTPRVKSYTLTKSTGAGIASHTVNRTRSPYQEASTGSLGNGATIYYGDELTHSATVSSGYKNPVVSWTFGGTPVTTNTTSTATATAKTKVQKTAYSDTLKYSGYTFDTSTSQYVFTYTGYISDIVDLSGDKELVSVTGNTGDYGSVSYNNYSFTSTISISYYGIDPDEMLNEFSFTVKVTYNEYS